MIIEIEHIERMMTGACGMPRWKADALKIPYPLKKGWKHRVCGQYIPDELWVILSDQSIKRAGKIKKPRKL
jgi:hypothetical protein